MFYEPKIRPKCVSGQDPAGAAHDAPPDPRLGRGYPSQDLTPLGASILASSSVPPLFSLSSAALALLSGVVHIRPVIPL